MIETFSKDDFESYLAANHSPFNSLGLIDGEETYTIPLDSQVQITVRSSVKSNGMSAGLASDSIRAWLVSSDDKPLGPKTKTTRQPGWGDRLNKKLLQIVKWRMLAGDCRGCDKPKLILKAETELNKGRVFAKCVECDSGFVWLDKDIDVSEIYFAGSSNDTDKNADGLRKNEEMAFSRNTDRQRDAVPEGSTNGNNNDAGEKQKSPINLQGLPEDPRSSMPSDKECKEIIAKALGTTPDDITLKPYRVSEERSELPSGPNPAQQSAIEADINTDLRVLAGPGSGKTFVIEHRYEFLVDSGVNPQNILVCTFGKNATVEMGQRIFRTCPQANIEQVCTINALCYRLLAKWYPDSRWYQWQGPKEWQVKKTLEDAIGLVWQEKEKPNAQEVYNAINTSKYLGLTVDDSYEWLVSQYGSEYGEWLYEIRSKFDAWLNRSRFLTYTDQLYLVEKRLQSDSQWRDMLQGKFQQVIVDEGQDVNAQAMRILITLSLESGQNTVYESEAR